MATLEARGRVHFCCSNDLKEKNLFDAIAIENGVEKCFKTCLKVCTKGLVSYFSFFCLRNVLKSKKSEVEVGVAVSCCEKVNKNEESKSHLKGKWALSLFSGPDSGFDIDTMLLEAQSLIYPYRLIFKKARLILVVGEKTRRFDLACLKENERICGPVRKNRALSSSLMLAFLPRANGSSREGEKACNRGCKPDQKAEASSSNPPKRKPKRKAKWTSSKTVFENVTISNKFSGVSRSIKGNWKRKPTRLVTRGQLRRILMLAGDVERNPGPHPDVRNVRSSVSLVSYNVRGLNDDKKLRHLINYCYTRVGGPNDDFFCLLQETYIMQPLNIPYLWRGNFHLTEGTGHSCGCVTLMSSHISCVEARNLGERGHILVCQKAGDNKISYIIANIYAPNPNNSDKIDFFDNLFETLNELSLSYDCLNLIVAGDFNLVFKKSETKNRLFTSQEKRVAESVKNFVSLSNLTDIWERKSEFTWNRANSNSFSTIDRVLFSREQLNLKQSRTNWTLSVSDHAAIEVGFEPVGQVKSKRSNITRLDASLFKDEIIKSKITAEIEAMVNTSGSDWNPHLKLEFAKMCIRTVMEKAQADRKVKEKTEEDYLNIELDIAVRTLQNGGDNVDSHGELLQLIEELRGKKRQLVDEKGERLANKLGTKWYHEGEKSNKYFLGLMKRASSDKFSSIEGDDGLIKSTEKEVMDEIVKFYKNLYENYDNSKIENNDDFFSNVEPLSDLEGDPVSNPITLEELRKTLATCRDSAPGPDGIPYSVIRELWTMIGPLILASWNYSLTTGNLCPSHRLSFLKLIPKLGKDINKLTNWRPITLSNCDHKIITKTYANRMSEKLALRIKERQTAYIKTRLINDNVRALLASISASNADE